MIFLTIFYVSQCSNNSLTIHNNTAMHKILTFVNTINNMLEFRCIGEALAAKEAGGVNNSYYVQTQPRYYICSPSSSSPLATNYYLHAGRISNRFDWHVCRGVSLEHDHVRHGSVGAPHGGHAAQPLHDGHAFTHATKNGVLAVQPGRGRQRDEEL